MKVSYIIASAALVFGVGATGANAQEWPSAQPVRLIVPFGAGGMLDAVARVVANGLQEKYGQSFVVENIAGASGSLGANEVAQAEPDGYTLLFASQGPAANAGNIFPDLPYDPLTDLTPITNLYNIPPVLVTSAQFAPNSMQELIDYAKEHPHEVSAGHPGPGSFGQMSLLAMAEAADIEINLVPYSNSTAGILADLLAGNIQIAADAIGGYIPNQREGNLKFLGVLTPERSTSFPDIPTFTEQGVDLQATLWSGLEGPAGMDPALVTQINADVTEILVNDPRMKTVLDGGAAMAAPTTPEEYGQIIANEEAMWRPIIEKYSIRAR